VQGFPLATAAANLLIERLHAGDPRARRAFTSLLAQGEIDQSYDLVREAGFDMATAAPHEAVASRVNRLCDELEKVLAAGEK